MKLTFFEHHATSESFRESSKELFCKNAELKALSLGFPDYPCCLKW